MDQSNPTDPGSQFMDMMDWGDMDLILTNPVFYQSVSEDPTSRQFDLVPHDAGLIDGTERVTMMEGNKTSNGGPPSTQDSAPLTQPSTTVGKPRKKNKPPTRPVVSKQIQGSSTTVATADGTSAPAIAKRGRSRTGYN